MNDLEEGHHDKDSGKRTLPLLPKPPRWDDVQRVLEVEGPITHETPLTKIGEAIRVCKTSTSGLATPRNENSFDAHLRRRTKMIIYSYCPSEFSLARRYNGQRLNQTNELRRVHCNRGSSFVAFDPYSSHNYHAQPVEKLQPASTL